MMTYMNATDTSNLRFTELRNLAGLGTEGEYEVRSNSTITGAYNIIGRTDDIRLVCAAAEMLNETHTVPCEAFTANKAIG